MELEIGVIFLGSMRVNVDELCIKATTSGKSGISAPYHAMLFHCQMLLD